ncbi:MAG: sensor histidine kinase [Polyangiaceae bacterium]|nr:sensor histidine kinase [Polyangiaceae bacterium]
MDFLMRLRRYLERVGQAPEGLPYVTVDVAAHRRFLLETIEKEWGVVEWREAELVNHGWDALRTSAVIRGLASDIVDQLDPTVTTSRLANLINEGIAIYFCTIRASGHPATISVPPADRHLYQIAAHAFDRKYSSGAWEFPPHYAFEVRLVQRRADKVVLSRCGSTFLEMTGIAAIQWLVTLEAAQSIGSDDDFRLSPEYASYLARERQVRTDDEIIDPTLERLEAFGLLGSQHRTDSEYWVVERHLPIFEEIGQRKSTPYAILADALLRDETMGLVERAHPDARMMQESAAATTALQARMVVHEVRNALVPAQIAFNAIVSKISDDDEVLQKRRARVEGGIQRALDFVDGMLRVANLGVEQPTTFDVATALRDACAAMLRELNGGFQQPMAISEGSVVGPRDRFVLAVTNLLRNAAQSIAGKADGRIAISTEVAESFILIHVDDNGAGVPVAQRSAIFEPGITFRTGGSGQGLALVRQVIEGEMRGFVMCTDAPLSGARFTLRIPLQSRTT